MTDNLVPWLRSGTGKTPAEGGCILQVIDWISTGGWSDHPECVHPVLRRLAIHLNDSLDDKGRQKLLDLTPRLMGTNRDDKVLSVRLAVFCARKVLHIFEGEFPQDDRPRKAIEAAERWCEEPTEENANAYAANAYAYAYAANAAANVAANAANAAYVAYVYAAANAAANAANAAYVAYAYAYATANATAYAAANVADKWQLFLDVLDEYDRLTGRTTHEPVDVSPAACVMAEQGFKVPA